ncbi:hypothetical protein NHX12_034356, partial [Muraenolepis orangiensis]
KELKAPQTDPKGVLSSPEDTRSSPHQRHSVLSSPEDTRSSPLQRTLGPLLTRDTRSSPHQRHSVLSSPEDTRSSPLQRTLGPLLTRDTRSSPHQRHSVLSSPEDTRSSPLQRTLGPLLTRDTRSSPHQRTLGPLPSRGHSVFSSPETLGPLLTRDTRSSPHQRTLGPLLTRGHSVLSSRRHSVLTSPETLGPLLTRDTRSSPPETLGPLLQRYSVLSSPETLGPLLTRDTQSSPHQRTLGPLLQRHSVLTSPETLGPLLTKDTRSSPPETLGPLLQRHSVLSSPETLGPLLTRDTRSSPPETLGPLLQRRSVLSSRDTRSSPHQRHSVLSSPETLGPLLTRGHSVLSSRDTRSSPHQRHSVLSSPETLGPLLTRDTRSSTSDTLGPLLQRHSVLSSPEDTRSSPPETLGPLLTRGHSVLSSPEDTRSSPLQRHSVLSSPEDTRSSPLQRHSVLSSPETLGPLLTRDTRSSPHQRTLGPLLTRDIRSSPHQRHSVLSSPEDTRSSPHQRHSITTLINHKDKPQKSERTLAAIHRVGQAVSVAVGRFVAVGEAIATENQELKEEMGQACLEARRAGDAIAQLTDASNTTAVVTATPVLLDGRATVFSDRTAMVKAARLLLSSVTKVLVLADRIVIKQIIASRNKVLVTLDHLEKVSTFQDFVHIFSQFGNEMVEFAHLTGDRQNDLKDENRKARMAAARAVLEKCTMMLLTASKTCLRHPDCGSARRNKEAVFQRMRCALETVLQMVTEAGGARETSQPPASLYSGIKDFKSLAGQLEALVERTEDFTDSAYTTHQQRQAILGLCQGTREDAQQLVHVWVEAQAAHAQEVTEEVEVCIIKTCQSVSDLHRELHRVALSRASELLRVHGEQLPLGALKASGGEGNLEAVGEYTRTLTEQKEQLVETCRLLGHVSGTEPLEITCVHAEETFTVIGPQIISASQTLALHPSSKIARENLEVFCEAWESQLCDLALLLKEISDVFEGRRGDKKPYLSLPRPGKHTASLNTSKALQLDGEEQTSMAQLGVELRLLSSDLDGELDKWEEPEHQVVKHSQNMASMGHSIYLFTRGEGLLKTTLDLFHQAEVLSEEGLQLCSSLRNFSIQLVEEEKAVVMSEMENLLALCQQLQTGAKTSTPSKTAAFQKVDSSIQTSRAIMAALLSLLPLCNQLNRKSKSERSSLGSPRGWRERQEASTPASTPVREASALNGFGVKSLGERMAGVDLLESQ